MSLCNVANCRFRQRYFRHWRNSWGNSPIGEIREEIRQQNEFFRLTGSPIDELRHEFRQLYLVNLQLD
jgi:hypothetical protein